MEILYNTTSSDAREASEKASQTYREALSIYTEVESIRVTEVDVTALNEESNQIKSDVCVVEFRCCFVCKSFTENLSESFNENFMKCVERFSKKHSLLFPFILSRKNDQICTEISENVGE